MEDQELVALIKKKSEKGMLALIEKYGGLVKYIAIKILGNEQMQEVEECISDVFYEVWCKIEAFNEQKGNLKTFIGTITKYKAIDRYRKIIRYSQKNIPLEEDQVEVQADIEEEVIDQLEKEVINEVLEELKEPNREIFIRRYYFFQRVKEIAKALKINEKLVENTLYRGKQKIKKSLEQKGGSGRLWNAK